MCLFFNVRHISSTTNSNTYIDYSCAWEKDILWQGRIYITDTALCFYSKILFGNEIKETIWMKNIARIEKSSVAGVIPNAITVYTLNPEGRVRSKFVAYSL